MISSDVRHAVARAVAAEGFGPADPGLRPTGTPGQYASAVAFASGEQPGPLAARLAARLADADWIARAEVTGPGFVTVTVTAEALAAVADRVVAAGPGCAASDALRGVRITAPPGRDPLAEATWEKARAALASELTARLAAAAGATADHPPDTERSQSSPEPRRLADDGGAMVRYGAEEDEPDASSRPRDTELSQAVAWAGADAVRFALARAAPGRAEEIDRQIIARHVPGNPAYAVRYAHARAASGVRWAANRSPGGKMASLPRPSRGYGESLQRPPRRPGGPISSPLIGPPGPRTGGHGGSLPREAAVLVDALSWLPERAAIAARRGRPDEFARYLEELAGVTIAALVRTGSPAKARGPGTDRLGLAEAARTGLAAGLGLLGVGAPDRL